jgi:hypothetical protein
VGLGHTEPQAAEQTGDVGEESLMVGHGGTGHSQDITASHLVDHVLWQVAELHHEEDVVDAHHVSLGLLEAAVGGTECSLDLTVTLVVTHEGGAEAVTELVEKDVGEEGLGGEEVL